MSASTARILLIYPPSRTQTHANCPAGLTSVGAVLEKAGHQVRLLDANARCARKSVEEVAAVAADLDPDIIGVTLLTPMVKDAYRLAAALRGGRARLLAGGPHATLLPEEPLRHGFDAAVIGEGEPTAAEAVDALRGGRPMDGVRGIAYRTPDGQIRRTEPRPPVADLDGLPPPARHLVNPLDYGPPHNPELHANLFSSRGCPARCTYCAGHLFGKRFRFRSAPSLIEEMCAIHRQYGTRHFYFMDDAMSMDRSRLQQFCDGLLERQLGFTWTMMTRIDAVNEEMLSLAARAGCVRIDYGIESGHPDTLKRIRKPHTVEMVRRVVPMTSAVGIEPCVFFILGFPWDTPESLQATWDLMIELAPHVAFHPAVAGVLIPFPGTEIYETYKDRYGLQDWWLTDDRHYHGDSERPRPYFMSQLFPVGTVLDANFFQYSPAVRRKIVDIFRFMFLHRLQREQAVRSHLKTRLLLTLSERAFAVAPSFERVLFRSISCLRQWRQGLRSASAAIPWLGPNAHSRPEAGGA